MRLMASRSSRSTATSSTAIPTSAPSSTRSPRWRRSRVCSSARGRRSAAARRGSRTSARSRGCSRGRRRAVVLPAWYGLGTALAAARERFGLELLAEMEHDWPFFAGLMANAEMACAKTDLDIAPPLRRALDDDVPRERHLAPDRRRVRPDVRGAHRRHRRARGCSTASPTSRHRSTAAPRMSIRSRSSRSSCCAGRARRRRRGAGASELPHDQRHRRRPAQHRLSPSGVARVLSFPPPR